MAHGLIEPHDPAEHPPLPRRPLGSTEAWVSSVGFGAASLGNLYRETTDAEAAGAVAAAWQCGIRSFDTAPHYGLGLSERRLGEALTAYPRDEYQVSTKVGRLLVPNPSPGGQDESFVVPDDRIRAWDFSRDGILRSLEESLTRLGLDRVDTVFAHDPDVAYPGAAKEALSTLSELREEGVISAIGIGTNDVTGLADLLAEGSIDVIMLAGRYTLLEQSAIDTVLEPARRVGASIIAVGVYNSGLLSSPRPPASAMYNYLPAPPELLERANLLADICESYGFTLPEAALAFPTKHVAVSGIALGMRTDAQVHDNLSRFSAVFPDAFWAELVDAKLIDPRSIAV